MELSLGVGYPEGSNLGKVNEQNFIGAGVGVEMKSYYSMEIGI